MIQQQSLAITFFTTAGVQLIREISEAALASQCEVIQAGSRLVGEYQSGSFYVSGGWIGIAKLESKLDALNGQYDGVIRYFRSKKPEYPEPMVPYMLEACGAFQADMLSLILEFSSTHELSMLELSLMQYASPHSYATMQTVSLLVLVPCSYSLINVRDAFFMFCETHNFDPVFEMKRN